MFSLFSIVVGFHIFFFSDCYLRLVYSVPIL